MSFIICRVVGLIVLAIASLVLLFIYTDELVAQEIAGYVSPPVFTLFLLCGIRAALLFKQWEEIQKPYLKD